MADNQTRTALVTGASKGIGRGIALKLAQAGWDVAINYFSDATGADATAERIRGAGQSSWTFQADVGDSGQVARMFEELERQTGGLRLLVNNSARQTWSSLLDLREEDWDRTIQTNLKGTFLCTQRAARLMQRDGGSIINIGSGCNTRAFPSLVDYTASKGGIEMLTKVSALELSRFRIRVNCIAPGAIEIERTKQEANDYAGTWAPLTPLGRIGVPEDVAQAVVFLASDEADFITAQTLYVDGGLNSKPQWPYEAS